MKRYLPEKQTVLKEFNWHTQKKKKSFLYTLRIKMPCQGFSYFLHLISGQGRWKHLFQLNSRKQTEFIGKGEA